MLQGASTAKRSRSFLIVEFLLSYSSTGSERMPSGESRPGPRTGIRHIAPILEQERGGGIQDIRKSGMIRTLVPVMDIVYQA